MSVLAARLPGITFETRTPPVPSPLPRMDIAGFVGYAASGPVQVPVAVEDAAGFHDIFGEDLVLAQDDQTRAPVYAQLPATVRAFFRNGGVRCWIVRVAGATAEANRFVIPGLLTTRIGAPGVGAAIAWARSPGSWSDDLLVNAVVTRTPLPPPAAGSPPGFMVNRLRAGDLVQLDYAALGIVAFQPVVGGRDERPPLTVAVPDTDFWFKPLAREDLDPFPFSPPAAITWFAAPASVRWLTGGNAATDDPALPIARWGVRDAGVVVELDREDLAGVQPGSWVLIDIAPALPPAGARPFLFVQVDRIQSSEDHSFAASPEPTWIVASRAWWMLDPTAAGALVAGIEPRAAVVTFELWVRDPVRGIRRLSDLGFVRTHERYWGVVPDDEMLFRDDPKQPPRLDDVSAALLKSVRDPAAGRFPLAAPRPAADVTARPVFFPLGLTGVPEDAHYQAALPHSAAAIVRDGVETFDTRLFLDPELRTTRSWPLVAEAFQIQYVNAYNDPWQAVGRSLTGIHALLPLEEVSAIAVPDAAQRPWFPDPTTIQPLEAPTLIDVSAHGDTVHVEWIGVEPSPPGEDLTYLVQASFDPRFAVVARSWPVDGFTLDHDASIFAGCPAAVFYRVRAESTELGHGPWSNTLWDILPPSVFEQCPDAQPAAPAHLTVTEIRGRFSIAWTAVAGASVAYTLERASDSAFVSATTAYAGTDTTYEVLRGAEPVVYFRVAAIVDGVLTPWSRTVVVGLVYSEAVVTWPADQYDEQPLLDVQSAAIRMCAARGDMHAVLGLPLHFDDATAIDYVALLRNAVLDDDVRVLSYGALFHPWIAVRESTGRTDLSTRAIAPEGAMCGTIAARTIRSGAWYSPANQFLAGAVALLPEVRDAAVLALLDARINPLAQQPRGFAAVDAVTLHPGDEIGELTVRRLLILLRRLALREGTAMVFRPNDDALRRFVQREFERVLGDLFIRGAFAGESHDEGYRVVADGSINPPQSIDQGRFIVELRVAPSRPLKFMTVRLVQQGGTLLAASEN